jgi:hypothetical protein
MDTVAPQEGGGFARVTEFVKLNVGEDIAASPELGEKEDRGGTGQQECPPDPIAHDAIPTDDARNEVRSVRGEGGGDHGRAQKPPRHRTPAEEVAVIVLPGVLADKEANAQVDGERHCHDDPIDGLEVHAD